MKAEKPGCSLPLQIILYVEMLYSMVYYLIEAFLYIFRGYYLAYPPQALSIELAGLFFFGVTQFLRIFIGNTHKGGIGNKTERADILMWSLILLVPTLFGGAYFIRVQVYV
jgi:hypothetical protein